VLFLSFRIGQSLFLKMSIRYFLGSLKKRDSIILSFFVDFCSFALFERAIERLLFWSLNRSIQMSD